MQKWIILGVIILIIIIGIVIVANVDIETEYVPESEIEEVELRKTIVSLYFKEKNSDEITKETRLLDSKELLKNPYEKLVNMILEGPQNENLEKAFPENVKVLETKFENGTVIINLSSEFSNFENKETTIQILEKTLKELTEVTNVRILIEGKEMESNEITMQNTDAQNLINPENTIAIE